MKTTISFIMVAFLILLGCSKSDDFTVNPDENQLKSARTASPIAEWTKTAIWDNNSVLQTALWLPPS